ncbi:MAG: PAS domain S-box protein [Candidatus Woesearchaeota archaeon]
MTERKEAEEALKVSEEKLRNVLEFSPNAITVTDMEGNVIECNEQTAKLHGFPSKDAVIGKSAFSFIAKEDQDRAIQNMKHALEHGSVKDVEYTLLKKDGARFSGELSASVITDSSGKPVSFVAITKDISDRKKAEAEREQLHDDLREKLNMIRRQNLQLINLQRKFKQYSRELEHKVNRLEKNRLDLTDNEKIVLYTMTAYPDLNDQAIADKTDIKRSTVTAIKNRLRKQNQYHLVNIPNLKALGCGLLTVTYGNYAQNYSEVKKQGGKLVYPGLILTLSGKSRFMTITASKDLVEHHNDTDPLIRFSLSKGIFTRSPRMVHFPVGLCNMYNMFDFTMLLNNLFGLRRDLMVRGGQNGSTHVPLTKGMKEVLYALVKYPEATTTELAKRLRVTRTTVSVTKNRLFKEGLVSSAVIPDISGLGCEMIALSYFRFNPHSDHTDVDAIQRYYLNSHSVVCLSTMTDKMCLGLFRDYAEHSTIFDSEVRQCRSKAILADDPELFSFDIDGLRQFNVDFTGITRRLLEIKDDF